MLRRRLLAMVGALGLAVGLFGSGVAAQADTAPGPDSTYSALLATYSWSGHDTCYANGGAVVHPSAGVCTITQTPNGKRNIAVCVQSSNDPAAPPPDVLHQPNQRYPQQLRTRHSAAPAEHLRADRTVSDGNTERFAQNKGTALDGTSAAPSRTPSSRLVAETTTHSRRIPSTSRSSHLRPAPAGSSRSVRRARTLQR